jgi:hypothetical protein
VSGEIVATVAIATLGLVAIAALVLRSLGDITDLIQTWRGTPPTEEAVRLFHLKQSIPDPATVAPAYVPPLTGPARPPSSGSYLSSELRQPPRVIGSAMDLPVTMDLRPNLAAPTGQYDQ